MATSILPVLIIVSIALGIGINFLLYKILKRNLITFLLSLLVIPVVGEILKGIVNSMLPKGPFSLGSAFAIGIGAAIAIIIGVVCYVIATFGTSVYRWWKFKGKMNRNYP